MSALCLPEVDIRPAPFDTSSASAWATSAQNKFSLFASSIRRIFVTRGCDLGKSGKRHPGGVLCNCHLPFVPH
jgi:hypothetical protein